MLRILVLIALVAVGCGRAPEPAPAPPRAERPTPRPKSPVVVNQGAVRALLVGDDPPVPTKAQLDVHGDAAVALRRLALQDGSVRVRRRAIEALEHYPNPATRKLLSNMVAAERLQKDLKAQARATLDRIEASAPTEPAR